MRPSKDDEALVDVLDVLLRDGAVLRADVIVSVADIPLVGIKLTAAIAGMETMTEYGLFEEWDLEHRRRGITRRQSYQEDSLEESGRAREDRSDAITVPGAAEREDSPSAKTEASANRDGSEAESEE